MLLYDVQVSREAVLKVVVHGGVLFRRAWTVFHSSFGHESKGSWCAKVEIWFKVDTRDSIERWWCSFLRWRGGCAVAI